MNRLCRWITLHPTQFSLIAWVVLIALLLIGAGANAQQTIPNVNVQPSTGPVPTTPFTAFDDHGVFSVPTGVPFAVYFKVRPEDTTNPTYVQYRRARREGGAIHYSAFIPKATWLTCPTPDPLCGGFYDALPRSGHYWYELRLCTAALDATCSEWATTLSSEYASVGTVARSWWIYAYLAPAGKPSL